MPKVALYAGSFDPITNGHADLIRRCADLLKGTEARLDDLGERHASLASAFREVGILLRGEKPDPDKVN